MDFAQILSNLMEERSLTNYQLAKDLDIHPTTVANWLSGKEPRKKTLSMLSEYFNVTVDYLLTGEQQKKPILNEKDERDIGKQIGNILDLLNDGNGLTFEGNPLSSEALDSIKSAMELGMRTAKLEAKMKYAPKKYRKED